VLFAELNTILAVPGVDADFDNKRWGNLYAGALRPFFESLRDVYRFISTLKFHAQVFRQGTTFEVNLIDLIAVETLRVFEPSTYAEVRLLKTELTERSKSDGGFSLTPEHVKASVEAAIHKADAPGPTKELIVQLFPFVGTAFGGAGYGSGYENDWARQRRVCVDDYFDRYFHLAIPTSQVSEAIIQRVLAEGRRDELVKEFKRAHRDGVLAELLVRLDPFKADIPLANRRAFISALFDIGDDLPQGKGGMFEMPVEAQAGRLVHWALKTIESQADRTEVLLGALNDSDGLFLPCRTISSQSRKTDDGKEPQIPDEALQEARMQCVARISAAATQGTLLSHREVGYLLFHWAKWAEPGIVADWLRSTGSTPDGAVAILRAFRSEVRSMELESDRVTTTTIRPNIDAITEFVTLEDVEQFLSVAAAHGDKETNELVHAFKKGLERKQAGKSTDVMMWSTDDE
jgi:hypothetical protein